MKKLILSLALVMMLGRTTSAYALVYTPAMSELFNFAEISDNPTNVAAMVSGYPVYSLGGVWYNVDFKNNAQQIRTILLGNTSSVATLAGYDYYGLSFENMDNNDPVKVRVDILAGGGAGIWYPSSWVDLSGAPSGIALLDLNDLGGNISNIQKIGLTLEFSGNKSDGQGGYQGDYVNVLVKAVPEPGSMMLLGMGILGLFGLRKRT